VDNPKDNDFRVSVVLPSYNRAHFLKAAVDSVLNQTTPVFELIIVDDGSTDDTPAFVEQLSGIVRYVRQENRGPAAARNTGMREAKGDWIAFQDSDDLWVADKIQTQVDFLARNRHLEFVFGHLANFTGSEEGDRPEILNREVYAYLKGHATDLQDFFVWLLVENPVPTPSVMFHRKCLEQVGYFDETLRCGEDYEYWLRFAYHCRAGFIDRVLVKRRMHNGNLINDYASRFEQHLMVLEQIPRKYLRLSGTVQAALRRDLTKTRYRLGSWYFKRRNFGRARQFFEQVRWPDLWPDTRSLILFPLKNLLTRQFAH
jgi:glycosyltransferase involved in cell wall biosynthesis